MTGGDLHPQLVPPNRIILAVNDKALAADAVFTLYKLRGFLRRRVGHKVINQPELASVPIAATAQHFVHFGCLRNQLYTNSVRMVSSAIACRLFMCAVQAS